jgi:hypothetical protein
MNKNTSGTPARRKNANAIPPANPGITNVQNPEPASEGGNVNSNQSRGRR